MAIKILSYNAYPDPKYVSVCSCGCQFTFNKSDTHFDRSSNQSYIECPNPRCSLINYESIWYLLDPLADKYDDNDNYRNELNDLKSKIKLHKLVKLAEEKKDRELKQMALKILKEEYGENEESI